MQSYVVRTKKYKSGDEMKLRYYGVPVTSGQIDDEYLAKEISERSSLTEPDVLAAIASLKVLMRKYLKKRKYRQAERHWVVYRFGQQ